TLAEQKRHQPLGEVPLADTRRPMQQIGMGMLLPTGEQLPEPGLPGENAVSHAHAPATPAAVPASTAERRPAASPHRSLGSDAAPASHARDRHCAPTRRTSALPARNDPGALAPRRGS